MTNHQIGQINAPILVLVGPTAIGKTALSLEIVREFDCEIISMDSMQVYRHMDIGTAKPTEEEQRLVRHHLIDIIEPDEQYNAACFVKDCLQAIGTITDQGKIPLVTGGTGLYLSSLVNGLFDNVHVKGEVKKELRERLNDKGLAHMYNALCTVDPISASRIHHNDQQRILRGLEIYYSSGTPWSTHLDQQRRRQPPVRFKRLFEIGLTCDRELLYRRIEQRTTIMMNKGLVDEVKSLRSMGCDPSLPSMQAIGYRHVNMLLDDHWTQGEMTEYLVRDTRRYAKRQITWFRRHSGLHWYDRSETDQVLHSIESKLEKHLQQDNI